MRSVVNFCLANLAVADFCVGVFCVLPNLSLYMSQHWHGGRVRISRRYFNQEALQSQRGCAMLCVWTYSNLSSVYHYTALDLPMRTTKFCSLLFGVPISVINKIHWCVAYRRPSAAINKCRRIVLSPCSSTLHAQNVDDTRQFSSHRRQSQVLAENRDFCRTYR